MVLIKGLAFPLNKLNKNGQGIPYSEAENAINSLRNAVVRICNRTDPHGCDFSGDPNTEIGSVVDVVRIGDDVFATAEIRDSIASQKIVDGVWSPGWSLFAETTEFIDGWGVGVDVNALTLVNDPAWPEAKWAIASAKQNKLLFFNNYNVIPMGDSMENIEHIEKEIETVSDVRPEQVTEQKPQPEQSVDDLLKKIGSYEEQIETLKSELANAQQIAAAREADLAKKISMEDADKMIASAIAADHEATKKRVAMDKLIAARKSRNLETNVEMYAALGAAELEQLADEYNKLFTAKTPEYPVVGAPNTGYTVGNFNKGKWEV